MCLGVKIYKGNQKLFKFLNLKIKLIQQNSYFLSFITFSFDENMFVIERYIN